MFMNKKILLLCVTATLSLAAHAQLRMRDVFAQLPDSVLPYMTRNNRLDCIDFIENGIEARVSNRFDQSVVLDSLTEDFLLLRTSSASYVEAKLLPNGNDTVICVNRTYTGNAADSDVKLYTRDWALLQRLPRPAVSEFLRLPAPDSLLTAEAAADTLRMIRQEAEYLPLMKAALSPSSANVTWTLQTAEFTREIKKTAHKYVHPVTRAIK